MNYCPNCGHSLVPYHHTTPPWPSFPFPKPGYTLLTNYPPIMYNGVPINGTQASTKDRT